MSHQHTGNKHVKSHVNRWDEYERNRTKVEKPPREYQYLRGRQREEWQESTMKSQIHRGRIRRDRYIPEHKGESCFRRELVGGGGVVTETVKKRTFSHYLPYPREHCFCFSNFKHESLLLFIVTYVLFLVQTTNIKLKAKCKWNFL